MAWIERFTCDVCGKLRGGTESWWMAVNECVSSSDATPSQPVLKLMPWNNLLGHGAESKHLCGAVCAHTFLDRWMAEFHAGNESCQGISASTGSNS